MNTKRIILIVISIIFVSLIQLNFTPSHIEFKPGIVVSVGTSTHVLSETKEIYYPPQIFGIDIPKGIIGVTLLLFIQSLFGIFLQGYIIYIVLKNFILKESLNKENYKMLIFLIVIFFVYLFLFLLV